MKETATIRRYELPEPFLAAGATEFPVYKKSGEPSRIKFGYLVATVDGVDKFAYGFQIKREPEEIARQRFSRDLISRGFAIA